VIDESITLFKGRVAFRQKMPLKPNATGIVTLNVLIFQD
jgi:hypothetical protein